MKLLVRYSAQLRNATSLAEEEVELPAGSTLGELLTLLAERHTQAAPHLLSDRGQPRPSLLVVVNDHAIPARQAGTTGLLPHDIVSLLPPIAGG